MRPEKLQGVDPNTLTDLRQLPNIGPAMAEDLRLLGFEHPHELIGQDPVSLYLRLCKLTGKRHDPCVLDVFFSIVRYMEGQAPRPWWHYTQERKALQGFLDFDS